jgi:hypothetical protein
MKFKALTTALVAGALVAPAALAKTQGGLRVKSGAIHTVAKGKSGGVSKLGSSTKGKVRKPRKPIVKPAPGAEL